MRVVFFGTPPFAAKTLESLFKHKVDVCAVVSRPDRPKGRKRRLQPTAVKEVASQYPNLPIHQPEKVSTEEFAEKLASYKADLFVVVAFGEILKQSILDIPKLACINVHASLLPKYRGASPIQSAIIQGESETGVSIMHMVKKMDAGNVIAQEKIEIGPEESFGHLQDRLCAIGSELLLKVIDRFDREGRIEGIPQDPSQATFAKKIESSDCRIEWDRPAQEIYNLIRGVDPYPGAFTELKIKGEPVRLKVFKAKIVPKTSSHPLVIPCGDDALQLLEIQPPGKKRMKAQDFLRGISEEFLEFS